MNKLNKYFNLIKMATQLTFEEAQLEVLKEKHEDNTREIDRLKYEKSMLEKQIAYQDLIISEKSELIRSYEDTVKKTLKYIKNKA